MKRRFFVAIPVPSEIRQELRYAIDRVETDILSCGRAVPEEDWHITFKFLGSQEEGDVPKFLDAMRYVVDMYRGKSKNIHITDVTFDDHRPPHVVWAKGDSNDSRILGEMRASFDEVCKKKGVPVWADSRDFTTHITLIRLFKKPPRETYIREPVEMMYEPASLDLMESRLQAGGPEYTCVEKISLI